MYSIYSKFLQHNNANARLRNDSQRKRVVKAYPSLVEQTESHVFVGFLFGLFLLFLLLLFLFRFRFATRWRCRRSTRCWRTGRSSATAANVRDQALKTAGLCK